MTLKYLYMSSANGDKTHSKEVRWRISNSVEITGLTGSANVMLDTECSCKSANCKSVFSNVVFRMTPLVPLLGEFSVESKYFKKVGVSL